MQIYLIGTILAHTLLAAGVGAHAEVAGNRPYRWAAIVLFTGIFGVLLYLRRGETETHASSVDDSEHPTSTTLPDADWDPDRPRSKRLADPNALHIDIPDGPTLTPTEQDAVGTVAEYLDAHPDTDTHTLFDTVFPEAPAGYTYPAVWWTECVYPALDALPEVTPPSDGADHTLAFSVTAREAADGQQRFEVSDGTRSAVFELQNTAVVPASGRAITETSPGWIRLARGAVSEQTTIDTDRSPSRHS